MNRLAVPALPCRRARLHQHGSPRVHRRRQGHPPGGLGAGWAGLWGMAGVVVGQGWGCWGCWGWAQGGAVAAVQGLGIEPPAGLPSIASTTTHPPPPATAPGAGAAGALAQGGAQRRHGARGAGRRKGRQGPGPRPDRRALPQPAAARQRAAGQERRGRRARGAQGALLLPGGGRAVGASLTMHAAAGGFPCSTIVTYPPTSPAPTSHAPQALPDASSASSSADPDVFTRLPSSRGALQEEEMAGSSGAGGSWFSWLVNKGEGGGASSAADRAGMSEGGAALPPPPSRLQVRAGRPWAAAGGLGCCSCGTSEASPAPAPQCLQP
jgi:hypothetical protein